MSLVSFSQNPNLKNVAIWQNFSRYLKRLTIQVCKMSFDVVELLKEPGMTRVCAPMVRYSKLPFRTLVRRYNCDLCFTPMIMADSFVQSAEARSNEFSTNGGDKPLIVQFAAKNCDDFADATEMVSPYCNGVDLNCGCPQRWAIKDGYGCDLLTKPQLVKDMVTSVRNRISRPFTISVKIRLLKDIRKTIELCRTLEKANVSFITVHARTQWMRKEPIDLEGLKNVRESVRIPIIANGDVKCLRDAEELYETSKCEGIMSANGLLSNPGLFAGHSTTPLSCVRDWLDITRAIPTNFLCTHHHLVFMLEKVLTKSQRQIFNNLQSREAVVSFLAEHYDVRPSEMFSEDSLDLTICNYNSWSGEKCRKFLKNKDVDAGDHFLENLFREL